jgi:hypothetical protein
MADNEVTAEYLAEFGDPGFKPTRLRWQCEACRYGPVPTAEFPIFRSNETKTLCEVCASTMLGVWYEEVGGHPLETEELARMIAWGINRIRADLREGRGQASSSSSSA